MELQNKPERPYRSHLRPACIPCRRRKSRCHMEANADVCLMCRAHRTECSFPEGSGSQSAQQAQASGRRSRRTATSIGGSETPTRASNRNRATPAANIANPAADIATPVASAEQSYQNTSTANVLQGGPSPSAVQRIQHHSSQDDDSPLSLGSADDQSLNLHIVGPAVTNDSQVLADYLSGLPGVTRSTRMVIPQSAGRSKPVLFTMVHKRPLGVTVNRSRAAEKLEIIENLLQPYTMEVIDEYFKKVDICMPLLDEISFRQQYRNDKDKISPALLACLYAHMSIYWPYSPALSHQWRPDGRFLWNLASDAVYSELHLAPGMSIITAIILNIGGRPTTSLIGNGVLLGSAVSMAHSLGLNHNPMPWKIPTSEKLLRMKIWWALLIHDRWLSLAHGTPPHISRRQYDVPPPTVQFLCETGASEQRVRTAAVFVALAGLTEVLDRYLQQVYDIDTDKSWSTHNLELSLNNWVDSLTGCNRLIIIRGAHMDVPGAPNLRLAYLTTRLLLQRIELEAVKQQYNSPGEQVMNRYLDARRTAEEILIFTQELQEAQLGDFWMSVSAFAYPATVNFLLRCALETENSPSALAQSGSFRIARDLVNTLRNYQDNYAWEVGDICLAQHAEIVDKVLAGIAPATHSSSNNLDHEDFVMPDASIIDHFFPSLWDPLQNVW